MKTSAIAHDESEELREDMAAEERFVLDTESGFVMDKQEGEWLTTAEEVYLAMVEELERALANATGERLGSRTLDPIIGLIDCPQCGKQFDQTVCSCGYEHSCGGPSEACCIPGCSECSTKPNTSLTGSGAKD